MKLKDANGWFAAGSRMHRALYLLSDGAFRLFVYICLRADRNTGRLRVAQAELARALGKSRNSINSYFAEISRAGVCVCRPAANQHQPGEIEVADDFWPYHKHNAASPVSTAVADPDADLDPSHPDALHPDASHLESCFIDQIRRRLLQYQIVRSPFGSADRKLAARLFRQGVTLKQIDRAIVLGLARKYISSLNSHTAAHIYSLSYFLPLLDEIAHTELSDQYCEYLAHRLNHFNALWLARFQPGAASRSADRRALLKPTGSGDQAQLQTSGAD